MPWLYRSSTAMLEGARATDDRGGQMSRTLVTVATSALIAASLSTASSAAPPTKNALYEGTLFASGVAGVTKAVKLKVGASGRTARVTWSCGTGRAPSTLQFQVAANGTFKAYSNTGTLTVWSFVGRFVSASAARAVLHLNATCDGKGGTLNLKRKA
jgi:hypothetical protein